MDIDFTKRSPTPYQCSKMSDGASDSDDSFEDNTEEFHVSSKVKRMEGFDLTTQFAAICAQVEISEEDFQVLSDLLERIRKTAAQESNSRANKATLFRHNYLGLRHAGSNQLLVYLSGFQHRPLMMKPKEIEKLFQGSQLKPLPSKDLLDVGAGQPFLDVASGLLVGIVTHSDHQAEVVTCQLAKYLLSFDPSAKSVLTLVQYWARENKITLSSKLKLNRNTSCIPDPAALEWLVLFFLGQEKVIPTLQKLRNRVKKRSDVFIEGRPEFNVSFPCDDKLVREWKTARLRSPSFSAPGSNQYVLEVLHLVCDFFQFCCRRDLKGKVLNSVNGKILPVLTAIEDGLIEPSLCGNKCKDKRTFEVIRKKVLALEAELEGEIYLTQPFYNRRFEFCMEKFETQVRPLMQNTAKQLELYLDNLVRMERGAVELKSLFKSGGGKGLVFGLQNFYMMQMVPKTPESVREELGILTCLKLERMPILPLSTQFADIVAEVEIPDKEFMIFLNLIERMRKIVGGRNYITLFRHNYLKLRNAGSNHLLIYLSKFQHQPLLLNRRQIEKLFVGSQLTPLRSGSEEVEAGFPYFDEQSGLKLGLVTDEHHQTEVVTCQLAKHLFKFDPRAKSLVTLVHYWARENGVTLADEKSNVPDPAALEWLVLFFLGRKELIPTLKVLLNRASKKRDPFFEGNKKMDVAFPPDIKFIGEWRVEKMKNIAPIGSNEYVVEILGLAREFFVFCSNEDLKGKVLNTVNGEIIPVLSAIEEGLVEPTLSAKSFKDKCSFEEVRMKALAMEKKLKGEIYLMQPFLHRRFDICQEKFETSVRPIMDKTGKKLELYLQSMQKAKDDGTVLDVGLKSLFQSEREEILYEILETKNNIQPGPDYETLANLRSGHEQEKKTECPEPLDCIERESPTTTERISLSQLFQDLNDEVAIQAEEWDALIEFQKKLKGFFESHGIPECQLVVFRNRHLKLQPVSPDKSIYLFLDHSGLYSVESGTRRVLTSNWALLEDAVARINGSDASSEQTKRLLLATIEPGVGKPQRVPLLSFGKLNFHIATRSFLPEVQTCRMVEYYCTFDVRVKPLMTIVFYWAKLNNIRLGVEDPEKLTVGTAPDPALLEWLVIFFLSQKKVVPPPCEISGQNADDCLLFDGVNIGIKTDPQYAQEWRNGYEETGGLIYNVFELAQDFFHFWSQFRFKAMMDPIIIDLKKGRHIEKEEVCKNLENIRRLSYVTGISVQDLALIDSEPEIRESFYSMEQVVTILHPLHIKYGFAFCWKPFLLSVCPKMGVTAENLKKMLKVFVSGDAKANLSLEAIFQVNM